MPLDLLKEEQDRITAELAKAGAVLANTEMGWEAPESNLDLAMGLLSRFGEAYRLATSRERRWFNQGIVKAIGVDVDGVKSVVLAEPFRTILDDGGMMGSTFDHRTPVP